MTLAPLVIALRPQPNGLRRAYRKQKVGDSFHLITIVHGSSGYRLIRTVVNAFGDKTEEQICNFRTLNDLFVMAKRDGFYEEVAPNGLGWQGLTLQKPPTSPVVSYKDYGGYATEDEQRQAQHEMWVDDVWNNLGKNEVIAQEDENNDDYESYEFRYDEPDDDMLEAWRNDSQNDQNEEPEG